MRTVSDADKTVVLSVGTVKESGSPDELTRKGGIFASLAEPQTEGQTRAIA